MGSWTPRLGHSLAAAEGSHGWRSGDAITEPPTRRPPKAAGQRRRQQQKAGWRPLLPYKFTSNTTGWTRL
eukprot:10249651-Lingulodinium_polyedra.AAC.1